MASMWAGAMTTTWVGAVMTIQAGAMAMTWAGAMTTTWEGAVMTTRAGAMVTTQAGAMAKTWAGAMTTTWAGAVMTTRVGVMAAATEVLLVRRIFFAGGSVAAVSGSLAALAVRPRFAGVSSSILFLSTRGIHFSANDEARIRPWRQLLHPLPLYPWHSLLGQ
jgi:hypothetical protein